MLNCKYCFKECKNQNSFKNHERTCNKNLNRIYKNGMTGKSAWNKGLIGHPKCSRKGIVGHPHSDETKLKLSILAKERNLGGYQEKAGRSKKFKVFDSFGKKTVLQSSYELKCSEILNKLKIKWLRPKSIKYDKNKNYFADFYLTDYNIYLDPKNNYKAKLDTIKIKSVIEQNNIKLYVLLKENITEEYIIRLLKIGN